jgi:hypothetical protein
MFWLEALVPVAILAWPLAGAYERLRQLKAWRFYWTGLCLTLGFTVPGLILHLGWSPEGVRRIGFLPWALSIVIVSFAGTLAAFQRGEAAALRKKLGEDPARRGRSLVRSPDA